jgi:hypothetical protein
MLGHIGGYRSNYIIPSLFRGGRCCDYLTNTIKISKIPDDSINRRYT